MKNRNGSVNSAQAVAPALVCILCLLIPGSVALSQPFPSFMLDSTFVRCPGLTNATGVRAAFGPDTGLVVWTSRFRLLGVRVDRNGVPLDSVPFDISGTDREGLVVGTPGVAWGGEDFLVVWADHEAVKCALVRPDGQIIGRAVLDGRSGSDLREAAAAFDGTNFLAAWIAAPDGHGLTALFCRVSQQGVVLDSPPHMVAPQQLGRQYGIALCFYEDRYFAVWNDFDTIGVSGNFILPDGSLSDSAGFSIRHGIISDRPAVTHDRHNFIVSWEEWANRGFVKLARVNDGGIVLDTGGVLLDSFSSTQTALVSTGDTTLVVFRRDSTWGGDSVTLVAVRIDTALNRLDAEPVKLSAPGYPGWGDAAEEPSAVLCGNDYSITWEQPLTSEDFYQAHGRRLGRDGEVLDSTPVVLSYAAAVQRCPDVASDGDNFLAVWIDTRRDPIVPENSVRGLRFGADGTPLDSSPIWLDSIGSVLPPAVAYGGGCYLVTWYDSGRISTKRVTPAGVVLDSMPLRMPEPGGAGLPGVAFGDSTFLVVWPTSSAVHGCRVTPAGILLDSTPLTLGRSQAHRPSDPQVAFDGDNFLVARRDDDDVHRCVRVSESGVVLDSADITLGEAGWDATPEVAYGNGVYFVVDNGTSSCWRVSPTGILLDSVPHSYSGAAHIVFDGIDFMLLCQPRDTAGLLIDSLGAMRIAWSGRVLDSTPFTLVTADSGIVRALDAGLATNAAHRIAAVFECHEPTPYLSRRIRVSTFPAIVGIGAQREVGQPAAFCVLPNPASRLASLSFNLTQAGPVRVTAFDVTGRKCASLFSGRMKSGAQTLPLDTRRLANGVYFLRLEAGTTRHSTRLVVSR